MKTKLWIWRMIAIVTIAAVLLSACGSDDDDGGGATPVPTATPSTGPGTLTPTASPVPTGSPMLTSTPSAVAAVRGVLVVDESVRAGESDALTGAPELTFAGPRFDRSLSFAEWTLECERLPLGERSGSTDDSGRFEIGEVPAGDCTLLVTKTVAGNLMSFEVPFTVGDDGADVEAEVSGPGSGYVGVQRGRSRVPQGFDRRPLVLRRQRRSTDRNRRLRAAAGRRRRGRFPRSAGLRRGGVAVLGFRRLRRRPGVLLHRELSILRRLHAAGLCGAGALQSIPV